MQRQEIYYMSTPINLDDYVKASIGFAVGTRRVTLKYDLSVSELHYFTALRKIMEVQMETFRSFSKPDSDDALALIYNTSRLKSIKVGSSLWQHNVLYIVSIAEVEVPCYSFACNPVTKRLEVEFNVAILEADQ